MIAIAEDRPVAGHRPAARHRHAAPRHRHAAPRRPLLGWRRREAPEVSAPGETSAPWSAAPVPDGDAPVPPALSASANTAADLGSTTACGAPRPFAPEQNALVKPEPPVWLRTLRAGRPAGDDIALWGAPVFAGLADVEGGGKLAEIDMGASRGGNCLIAADSDYLRRAARVFTDAADARDAAMAQAAGSGPASVTEAGAWADVVADAVAAADARQEDAPVVAAAEPEPEVAAEPVAGPGPVVAGVVPAETAGPATEEERAGDEGGAEDEPEAEVEAA